MPPRETTHLLASSSSEANLNNHHTHTKQDGNHHHDRRATPTGILSLQFSFGAMSESSSDANHQKNSKWAVLVAGAAVVVSTLFLWLLAQGARQYREYKLMHATGPYKLVERQTGHDFFSFYDFLDGPDSVGSAGYNVYVGKQRAKRLGLINVTREIQQQSQQLGEEQDDESTTTAVDYIYLQSAATPNGGKRSSLRLEGKRRFDRGLFILDLQHMPAGCGMWPAFWLTDEAVWPDHGEMDVVEGINGQTVAKTALHTSESCSMYGHVSPYDKTGVWDTATGIPNTWTGKRDFGTQVEVDNCWVSAPHQWANQGCVAVSTDNTTLGAPLNAQGGGVYVLEWDPAAGYIKSWVFPRNNGIPDNLQQALRSANRHKQHHHSTAIRPDPATWNVLPYAYFAIGDGSGCSADHFRNMRLIFNLAFCGTVAGNRFARDCPALAEQFGNVSNNGNTSAAAAAAATPDPVEACNAYIASNPAALQEAYWKIRGVYVYERE